MITLTMFGLSQDCFTLENHAVPALNTVLTSPVEIVVNFFLVEAETRRRWDIFQAEVTLY